MNDVYFLLIVVFIMHVNVNYFLQLTTYESGDTCIFLNSLLPVNLISGIKKKRKKELTVICDFSFSNFITPLPLAEINFLPSCQALPTLFQ
jgi:hypothetical protein